MSLVCYFLSPSIAVVAAAVAVATAAATAAPIFTLLLVLLLLVQLYSCCYFLHAAVVSAAVAGATAAATAAIFFTLLLLLQGGGITSMVLSAAGAIGSMLTRTSNDESATKKQKTDGTA